MIRDDGLIPGLDDGSLASKIHPHFFPIKKEKSPRIPPKGDDGFLRKKCYIVPNLRSLWEKILIFELIWQGVAADSCSAKFELVLRKKVPFGTI